MSFDCFFNGLYKAFGIVFVHEMRYTNKLDLPCINKNKTKKK